MLARNGRLVVRPLIRLLLRGHARILRVPTHVTLLERLFLWERSRRLQRGGLAVEIGSYLGASSCFLAAGVCASGGRLICVDTWHNEGMTEGGRDTYAEFLANTRGFTEVITPIRMPSVQASERVTETFDLLFIDGDHSYEGVSNDLKCWLPKLRPGAWLILHDYGWAEGVRAAVRRFAVPLQVSDPLILDNLYAVHVDPRRGCREPVGSAPGVGGSAGTRTCSEQR